MYSWELRREHDIKIRFNCVVKLLVKANHRIYKNNSMENIAKKLNNWDTAIFLIIKQASLESPMNHTSFFGIGTHNKWHNLNLIHQIYKKCFLAYTSIMKWVTVVICCMG